MMKRREERFLFNFPSFQLCQISCTIHYIMEVCAPNARMRIKREAAEQTVRRHPYPYHRDTLSSSVKQNQNTCQHAGANNLTSSGTPTCRFCGCSVVVARPARQPRLPCKRSDLLHNCGDLPQHSFPRVFWLHFSQ